MEEKISEAVGFNKLFEMGLLKKNIGVFYHMYSREEILEAIARLEKQGLIEWRGEWRPASDGTLLKVYHATTEGRLAKVTVTKQ